MGMKKLSIAMIMVRDYQAMKDWYSKTLGLEITEATDDGQWASFALPGGGAEFAVHGGMDIPDSSVAKVIPCIEVDDLPTTVEDLRGRGVEILNEVRDPGHGQLLADIRDPEGNRINLFQPVA